MHYAGMNATVYWIIRMSSRRVAPARKGVKRIVCGRNSFEQLKGKLLRPEFRLPDFMKNSFLSLGRLHRLFPDPGRRIPGQSFRRSGRQSGCGFPRGPGCRTAPLSEESRLLFLWATLLFSSESFFDIIISLLLHDVKGLLRVQNLQCFEKYLNRNGEFFRL